MDNERKEDVQQQPLKKATFIVQVQYRQSATWQGQVSWSERGQTKPFRSSLELIRLMDSAMENNRF